MNDDDVATFPMQTDMMRRGGRIPVVVAMRAYEVYKELYGAQDALVTGDCRGGFGVGEVIAFLYAYGFPRAEWRTRVDEALVGLKLR